ncbi:MAG: hypothetical protein HY912_22560 [Desulfomonile tiedjei]|uniref:Uncharacterized protein n=1 Tax=Desulfomonile tiedjei TaxID=2358 RepID=A0A9D6V657_9BACT|nr:hypothetical protein [Desulfomonile tiedjei]
MKPSWTLVFTVIWFAVMFALGCVVPVASFADSAVTFEQFRQCKIDCNEAYGGFDIYPSTRAPEGQADCVLKCERLFWRNFDKDNRELEKDTGIR